MDFDFSDDQTQLRDAVAKWTEKAYGFERRRAIAEASGFDRAAYSELADLGLAGLCVSDAFGGMGMGAVECMLVQEELGKALVLEPLAQTFICSALLEAHAPDTIKQTWLGQMASGQSLVVLATQERKNRYVSTNTEAKAALAHEKYALTAIKSIVPAGDHADAFIVPAKLNGQLALFLVERGASGVSTRAYGCQDGSRAADVTFKDAPAQLITTSGAVALGLASDWGVACACAYGVGAMEKTLAITVDYMNTRKQFGATLASFQALRHRVADMKMQLELARSMSYLATLKLASPESERARACAQAKYQLGESLRFVGQQAVQLHGGIGVTDEYIVSHYFKALTQLQMAYGDSLHHLSEVATRLQDTAGVFS